MHSLNCSEFEYPLAMQNNDTPKLTCTRYWSTDLKKNANTQQQTSGGTKSPCVATGFANACLESNNTAVLHHALPPTLPRMLNFSSRMEAVGSTSKPGLVIPGFSHRCCVSMMRTAKHILVIFCHTQLFTESRRSRKPAVGIAAPQVTMCR